MFKEHETVDGFYIIARGSVEIFAKEVHLGLLRRNDYFGEIALLDKCNRTASARAVQKCTFLYLSRANFEQ